MNYFLAYMITFPYKIFKILTLNGFSLHYSKLKRTKAQLALIITKTIFWAPKVLVMKASTLVYIFLQKLSLILQILDQPITLTKL